MKNTIIGPIIKIYIVLFTIINIFLIFIINTKTSYISNDFILMINNQPFNYIWREYEKNFIFKDSKICSNPPKENEIHDSDFIHLTFNEYEKYDNNNFRVTGNFSNIFNNSYNYKEVKNPTTMKIKKNNIIIYEGEFKNNITDLIKDEGRYYIHIYISRKENKFRKIYTELSANFTYKKDKK